MVDPRALIQALMQMLGEGGGDPSMGQPPMDPMADPMAAQLPPDPMLGAPTGGQVPMDPAGVQMGGMVPPETMGAPLGAAVGAEAAFWDAPSNMVEQAPPLNIELLKQLFMATAAQQSGPQGAPPSAPRNRSPERRSPAPSSGSRDPIVAGWTPQVQPFGTRG